MMSQSEITDRLMSAEKKIADNDFEISQVNDNGTEENINILSSLKYLIAGSVFGIILVKSQLISWFRMQEMFRFQSFHMFGIMGSAVLVGIVSVWLIKRFDLRTFNGQKIFFPQKKFSRGQIFGGLIFGFGWALTGACPGPIFAQIGTGALVVVAVFASAVAGTWFYGYIRHRLPH